MVKLSPAHRAFLVNIMHVFRMLMMIGLLAVTAQLVIWNRNTDPRFYRFLGTPPGRLLAEVMNWPNLQAHRLTDKPESQFTDEELLWKRKLEDQILHSWPTHILTLENGKEE